MTEGSVTQGEGGTDEAAAKRENGRRGSQAAQRVLEAASELFYERGIRATGVDAIVEHSGVTKMTLYKHFGSKDELVAAYLRARDERWREWLEEAVESRADSPKERLLAVFDALGSWLEGEVEGFRGCAFINAATEIADQDHPARVVAMEQKRWMREYLASLAVDAGVRGPEELAEQLPILFEGATITTVMGSSQQPAHKAREAATALIGGGIQRQG
jgi:AcrR family transcriptional regulator